MTAQLHPSQHHPTAVASGQSRREPHWPPGWRTKKTTVKTSVKTGRMSVGGDGREVQNHAWHDSQVAKPSGSSPFKQTSATSPLRPVQLRPDVLQGFQVWSSGFKTEPVRTISRKKCLILCNILRCRAFAG